MLDLVAGEARSLPDEARSARGLRTMLIPYSVRVRVACPSQNVHAWSMPKLRSLLKPRRSTNHCDAERARTLHTILLSASLVLTVLLTLSLALRPDAYAAHARYGSFLVLHILSLILLCTGRVRATAIGHSVLYVLLATAAMWSLGGIRSPAGYVLPPAVLMAGLVWSGRAGVGVALAASVLGLLLVVAERQGMLPNDVRATPPLELWEVMTANLVITAVMLYAALRTMRTYQAVALHHAHQHEELVNAAPDAMVFMNDRGRIEALNPAAVRLFGVPELAAIGQGLFDLNLFDAAESARVRAHLREQPSADREPLEATLRNALGEVPVEVRVRACQHPAPGKHVTLRDVSQLRELQDRRVQCERQLEQARRLEALGRLAAGVAHDFNNLLTVILGQATVVARLAPQAAESFEIVQLAARRASELTRQLLVFGRRQVLNVEVVDVNRVLGELEPLIRKLCAEDVVLEFQYGPVRPIAVDRIQLEQVIVNLVSNARDAVASRGTVRLRTGSLTDEVWITVEDDGEGIDERVMTHLFEPFFTTKPAARGSGLGLATVHGIVTQTGGRVEVTSRPHQGTCFRVVFPVVGEFPPARRNARRIHTPVGKDVSILVVDDDSLVRGVVSKLLQDNGYPGAVAVDPAGAVAAAKSMSRLDLLVTDVVMPHSNGRELYEQIAQLHPSVRVLYCSGYADDFVASRGGMPAPEEYLPKPFTEHALLAKVSDVLTRCPIDEDSGR